MANQRQTVKSYRDLEVFQNSYKASITVLTQISPKLPKEEQYDLADQLRRSAKAIPRLIAEGYGKKHQKRGFEKYLTDAMSEANETVVGLSHCRDVYFRNVDPKLCDELIDIYDKTGRQLYKLAEAWRGFAKEKELTEQQKPKAEKRYGRR
jgi:four helix bundle protein